MLRLTALAFAVAASVLPVAPASAYCDPVLYELTGRCTNGCVIAGSAYMRADRAAKDLLPDVDWYCPA